MTTGGDFVIIPQCVLFVTVCFKVLIKLFHFPKLHFNC